MASTIELIKQLRDRTGAGMMDCKKALEENGNDIEKAVDWLREKGIAKNAKKQSRIAAEGLTTVKYCAKCGKVLVLEINCETDFVAKADAFKALIDETAKVIMEKEPATVEEAVALTADLFNEAGIKLGEKLSLRRFDSYKLQEGQGVGTYIHMGGKISVFVITEKANEELTKGLAMSIAANAPTYVDSTDIPADVYAKEKEIQTELAKSDPKLVGKPEQALAKIIEGKVNKQLSGSVLLKQEYLLDPTKTVEQVLVESNNKVVKFVRYQVGEGLEKRHDDFAAEVAKEANAH